MGAWGTAGTPPGDIGLGAGGCLTHVVDQGHHVHGEVEVHAGQGDGGGACRGAGCPPQQRQEGRGVQRPLHGPQRLRGSPRHQHHQAQPLAQLQPPHLGDTASGHRGGGHPTPNPVGLMFGGVQFGYLDLQAGVGEGGHGVLLAGHGGHGHGREAGAQEGQRHRLLGLERRLPAGCGDTAPWGQWGVGTGTGGPSRWLPGSGIPWKCTALSSTRRGSGGSCASSRGRRPRVAWRTQALMRCRSRLSLPLSSCGSAL